nr:hypothetical protein CFP56_42258 [Quercus suber]
MVISSRNPMPPPRSYFCCLFGSSNTTDDLSQSPCMRGERPSSTAEQSERYMSCAAEMWYQRHHQPEMESAKWRSVPMLWLRLVLDPSPAPLY